jgi:GxxExxY protein
MREDRKEDILSRDIIAAAIEVHRELGPGLLESSYEECLCHELKTRSISYEPQKSLPVSYKEIRLDCGYRLDVVVDNLVIVEIKAVESMYANSYSVIANLSKVSQSQARIVD